MAVLGYTKLEAVNQMLRAVNLPPATALDTGGSSEAGEAEAILDLVDRQVQSEGWPENLEQFVPYAAGTISVASGVLRIRGSGPDAHRNLVLREDDVYDADKGTTTITASRGSSVFLEVVTKLDFVNLSPPLKEKIVAQAALTFQRRKQGTQSREEMLVEEAVLADLRAQRLRPFPSAQPPNVQPVIPAVLNRSRSGQGVATE